MQRVGGALYARLVVGGGGGRDVCESVLAVTIGIEGAEVGRSLLV